MNALVLANFPIAALIFAAIVGIPLWLTFRRPDHALRDTGTRAYPGAVAVPVQASAPARRAAAPRVSTARQHMAARTAVPGRRHAAAARPAAQQAGTPAPHDHAAV